MKAWNLPPWRPFHGRPPRGRIGARSSSGDSHGFQRSSEAVEPSPAPRFGTNLWTLRESASSSAILATSDFCAQKIEKFKQSGSYEVEERSLLCLLKPEDVSRSCRAAVYGFFLFGPMVGFWYRVMDAAFGVKTPLTTIAKVFLSQTTVNPSLLALAFVYNYALTGRKDDIPGVWNTCSLYFRHKNIMQGFFLWLSNVKSGIFYFVVQ